MAIFHPKAVVNIYVPKHLKANHHLNIYIKSYMSKNERQL